MRNDVPALEELLWISLEAIRELGGSGVLGEVFDEVLRQLNLTESALQETEANGATKISKRFRWSLTYLKKMGLTENNTRAIWTLTTTGKSISKKEIAPAYKAASRAISSTRRRNVTEQVGEEHVEADLGGTRPTNPVGWQENVIDRLLDMPATAFEHFCARLLREAGFEQVVVTKRSGDGGIDGYGFYRNGLITFRVCFQAKRWKSSVGVSEVRDLQAVGQGQADKCLLITTSTFTSPAKSESMAAGRMPIDLIDGERLCELLAEYRLGVIPTTAYEIDYDFFDSFDPTSDAG